MERKRQRTKIDGNGGQGPERTSLYIKLLTEAILARDRGNQAAEMKVLRVAERHNFDPNILRALVDFKTEK